MKMKVTVHKDAGLAPQLRDIECGQVFTGLLANAGEGVFVILESAGACQSQLYQVIGGALMSWGTPDDWGESVANYKPINSQLIIGDPK